MGLLTLPTLIPVSLLSARCLARAICTTIPLRSLADPSGAFDIPKSKCPPDRGSSECVTGIPAPRISSSPSSISSADYSHISKYHIHLHAKQPPTTAVDYTSTNSPSYAPFSAPRAIPTRGASELSTPPLTPDDGSECSVRSLSPEFDRKSQQQPDALDFLVTLFPRHALGALPYAKNASISSPGTGASFEGIVLEIPGQPRTFYVDGKSAESVSLRESIVALLDLADERLHCSALVIVLRRTSPNLGDLLHSLMYVGGAVVTKPPFQVNPAFVLVGLEI